MIQYYTIALIMLLTRMQSQIYVSERERKETGDVMVKRTMQHLRYEK